MNLFGLPSDVYRLARLAERQVPEAALARFELVRRFDLLRTKGLTVAAASVVLGLRRATYCRWRRQARGGVERLAPRSRRPLRPRRPTWSSALLAAVERLRGTPSVSNVLTQDNRLADTILLPMLERRSQQQSGPSHAPHRSPDPDPDCFAGRGRGLDREGRQGARKRAD